MNRSSFTSLAILFLLLGILSGTTLIVGDIPWDSVWKGITLRISGVDVWNPLLDERLPRVIVLMCTGAALAVSGAVMQAMFQNPLAAPGVVGITSGGSLCVLGILISGLHYYYPVLIPIAAVMGSFVTMLIVYALARYHGGVMMTTLILTGIAISIVLMAVQNVLIYVMRENWHLIQIITEWEAGSTLDRTWQHVHMQLPITIVGLAGCWIYRNEINIMSMGEEEAVSLGVDVKKVRWRLFLCVSLLTGGALAGVGLIAFFGLVFPHMLRKLQGPDHRNLIPLSIVGGSCILLGMDLFLRVFGIQAFSMGNISAILGGVFFLILIFRSSHKTITV